MIFAPGMSVVRAGKFGPGPVMWVAEIVGRRIKTTDGTLWHPENLKPFDTSASCGVCLGTEKEVYYVWGFDRAGRDGWHFVKQVRPCEECGHPKLMNAIKRADEWQSE